MEFSDNKKIKVIKRNGSIEPFMPKKITKVLIAAGLEKSSADDLTSKVIKWVEKMKVRKITSLEIRTKVIAELIKVNPRIANLYTWYQKRKDEDFANNLNSKGKK